MYLRATNNIAKDNTRSVIVHRMTERWSIPERIIPNRSQILSQTGLRQGPVSLEHGHTQMFIPGDMDRLYRNLHPENT